MVAVRHLGLLKVRNFNCPYFRRENMRHHAKFRADWSSPCREKMTALFRFFRMAAVRCFGFLKVRNFNCQYALESQYASPYQISRWLVKPLLRHDHFWCRQATVKIKCKTRRLAVAEGSRDALYRLKIWQLLYNCVKITFEKAHNRWSGTTW